MLSRLRPVLLLVIALLLAGTPAAAQKTTETLPEPPMTQLTFGGGPIGGTFQYFANALALYVREAVPRLDISVRGTAGSAANLKGMASGQLDYAVAYMADACLARNGALAGEDQNGGLDYTSIRAVSFLYGAPAQLVARSESEIQTVSDLVGKKLAVGNPGSGAALSCQRYLEHLGLWDKVEKVNIGYAAAAAALASGQIDAFWLLAGAPNPSVLEAAAKTSIRLVPLDPLAKETGFYKDNPYYTPTIVPAGSYPEQNEQVETFQDAAYWMASDRVLPEVVTASLAAIYTEEGLHNMTATHKAAQEMTAANALKGCVIPIHPGAKDYWKSQGVKIPKACK